jgi:hypothetical protein
MHTQSTSFIEALASRRGYSGSPSGVCSASQISK